MSDTKNNLTPLSVIAHATATKSGFWEHKPNAYESIALIHSEVSELLEALRDGNPPAKHIPQHSSAEEECADIIIRVLDLAGANNWSIGEALQDKMEYNKTRPHKHGRAH